MTSPLSRKLLLGIGLVLMLGSAAGGFFLYRYSMDAGGAGKPATAGPAATPAVDSGLIGSTRPAFSLPDLEGEQRHVSEWDGRVLVVNFWATWCVPCLKEIPDFIELQNEYGDRGLTILGIALQDPAEVGGFVQEQGMNYPVLAGELPVIEVARSFGNSIGALPYTAVVDRDGHIAFVKAGQVTGEQIESVIQPLL